MQFKEGLGWKACYDEERNLYTAERSNRGFYQLCEIDKAIYDALGADPVDGTRDDKLIASGRCLFVADDDYYTSPYCIVKDDNYNIIAPWSRAQARFDRTYNRDKQS